MGPPKTLRKQFAILARRTEDCRKGAEQIARELGLAALLRQEWDLTEANNWLSSASSDDKLSRRFLNWYKCLFPATFRRCNSQRKRTRVVEVTLWLGRLTLRPECDHIIRSISHRLWHSYSFITGFTVPSYFKTRFAYTSWVFFYVTARRRSIFQRWWWWRAEPAHFSVDVTVSASEHES